MNKTPKVRRINPEPEFPKWQTPRTGAGFLFGAVLWILMIIVFLVFAYIQLFSHNTKYLLSFIAQKNYQIPLWFSILCLIFIFPATLLVILLGTLIRIIKD